MFDKLFAGASLTLVLAVGSMGAHAAPTMAPAAIIKYADATTVGGVLKIHYYGRGYGHGYRSYGHSYGRGYGHNYGGSYGYRHYGGGNGYRGYSNYGYSGYGNGHYGHRGYGSYGGHYRRW